MIWGWLIPGWLKRAVLALGAVALAILAAFGAGKREARRDAKAKAAKDAIETRRRIDNADDVGGDPDRAREWLRKHGDE
jgi:hypothetical protein